MFRWPTLSPRRPTTFAPARRWLEQGVDLLYPPACAHCGAEGRADDILLCTDCRELLADAPPACPRCAATLPSSVGAACPHCLRRPPRFQAAVRLGRYDGALRSAILKSKHGSDAPLSQALARLLAERNAAELTAWHADVVVAVPMHWSRRLWRGANTPDNVARVLAQRLQLPCAGFLLQRARRTRPQAGLTRGRRRANVRGAFRAVNHPDLAGARVLLVDDVMTTGATANEAARVLRRAGVAAVMVAMLGRADGLG